MPFAGEFREAMEYPLPGDVVEGFLVEEFRISHEGTGPGRYEYPTEILVSGKGGKEGVRRALKPLFARRMTIFTEFGNPYQCTGGRMEVERLGEGRYRVTARGIGTRVHLKEELVRFLDSLKASGAAGQTAETGEVVDGYLRRYWEETKKPRGGWWPGEGWAGGSEAGPRRPSP